MATGHNRGYFGAALGLLFGLLVFFFLYQTFHDVNKLFVYNGEIKISKKWKLLAVIHGINNFQRVLFPFTVKLDTRVFPLS